MGSTKLVFKERVTDIWAYPRICAFNDLLEDSQEFFQFLNLPSTEKTPVRIYLHTPFCNSFCFFCPFYKEPYKRLSYDAKRRYFTAVCRELETYSRTDFYKNRKISTVYFGGGDPSCVESEFQAEVLDCIYNNFDMSECEGISIEGNVLSLLDEAKLSMYKEKGVTRISFGVQTFKESLRKKLLLKPTLEDIYQASRLVKKAGFVDLTFDLIYNFPDQTIEDLDNDLEQAYLLNPTYIDVYNLNIYPNTRFKKIIDRGGYFERKPTNQQEIAMFRFIMEKMRENKYYQVASMCFSPLEKAPHIGLERFLKAQPMLGIGPSARGYLDGRSYRNFCSVEKYIDAIEADRYPVEAGNIATQEEQEERIMVFFPALTWIKKDEIPKYERFREKIEILIDSGYARWNHDILELTPEGKIWTGNIQRFFFNDHRKNKDTKSLLYSIKYGKNPYNQDDMGTVRTRQA